MIDAAKLRRLRDDFPYFAKHCLRIRTKAGTVIPFAMNKAQKRLHDMLEAQRRETGKVRAIILKGRQMGASTYIEGRFYWRLWGGKGLRAMILTHEQAATDNLFAMAKRYHDYVPEPLRHPTKAANAKELAFDGRDCSYAVATAGSKEVGRSSTLQLFHGCLTPDTQILCGDHLKAMRDFVVGDLVRTHTGATAPVSFISKQIKQVRDIKMKGSTGLPFAATDEHRFWTKDGWRELGDMAAGDVIGFPVSAITDETVTWPYRLPDSMRPQGGGSREVGPDCVPPDYNLGRILGLYLAEGSIKCQKGGEPSAVTFTVHEREVGRTVDWLGPLAHMMRSVKIEPRDNSKTVNIVAYGRSFATFVEARCGRKDSKRTPADWRSCGDEFSRGIVHGYLAGDGHSSARPNDRRISAPSIRPAITVGIRDMLASLGYGWASVSYRDGAIRNGRNEKAQWTLRLSGAGVDMLVSEIGWTMPERKRIGAYGQVVVSDGYAWVPVVSIGAPYQSEVMDFEVDHEDHSYCTSHTATHNSEVAFWPNAEEHTAGLIQAIADEPGTERIFESTANGIGNVYQRRYMAAERGASEDIAVFMPWYWDEGYRKAPPEDWYPSPTWEAYGHSYELEIDQLYWAFIKNRDMATATGQSEDEPCWKFKQEYPANSEEAFQTAGNSFVPSPHVAAARKRNIVSPGALVIGVDPARGGGDKTGVIDRQGRKAGRFVNELWDLADTMEIAGRVAQLIRKHRPAAVNIDVGGLGAGVVDRLLEMGYSEVNPVNFGSNPIGLGPTGEELYENRRAEMWDTMRDWFAGDVDIPDDDSLHQDVCAPVWGSGATRHKSNNELVIEPKDKIRERLGASPDKGDALALTFAVPLNDMARYDEDDDRFATDSRNTTGGY